MLRFALFDPSQKLDFQYIFLLQHSQNAELL
uniref:Uncharacterized protein n=1 Tax=Anguilla anguilla TaxID=7936 RepID=A0A0E9RHQ8_ANGAN